MTMRGFPLLLICAASLWGHPMGNFSVNHYARLEATAKGVALVYALDLAELPTFDLLRSWQLDRDSDRQQLERKAREQAQTWLDQLQIRLDGQRVRPRLEEADLVIADGAGNLPVLRITSRARISEGGSALAYEDFNYPDRAGWKEIVIVAGAGATLLRASQSSKDISHALTEYPPDPTLAPPQDLRAEIEWSLEKQIRPVPNRQTPTAPALPRPQPSITSIPQPKRAPVGLAPALAMPASAPAGTVVRGDFLSRLLHQREITPWMMLLGLAAAFILGAAHALTPGHGKTIVAAYLVGSRATLKHAAFLGAMVTFTHTISVFALGLATLFLFRFVMPEKVVEGLGVLSGLSIVAVGLYMLRKRLGDLERRRHDHHPGQQHAHHHHPGDDHAHHHHDHETAHDHGPDGHAHAHHHHSGDDHAHHHHHDLETAHDHGPGSHSHMPEQLSWAGLVALGASGGLVPCESALVLLLGAIAIGRVGLGLLLLLSFSAGLSIVLMTIGGLVLYAKNLIPERKRASGHPILQWAPLASAAVVTVLGLIVTGISLGWIPTTWTLS
jgi:nickel/cobalt transporter (NicO) family protein